MNMNRPDMTETVKSENYTNKFLQKDSNPVTMKASKSPAIGSSDQTKATSCLPGGGNRPAFGDFSSRCVQPLQHHEGFPGAAHRHQHPGEQAEFRQLVCGGLREVIYGIYYETRRFLLRPLQVQRPFRQALRGMGEFQDQKGGAGAKDHGRERTAGRHVPRPRHHDGGGDAVQADPDPVHQAQMVPQDLHQVRGDGAKPYRAVYREAESAGAAHLRH